MTSTIEVNEKASKVNSSWTTKYSSIVEKVELMSGSTNMTLNSSQSKEITLDNSVFMMIIYLLDDIIVNTTIKINRNGKLHILLSA